ncbi:MAG: CDP-glycerol glycerophosphotransferase family protein [Chloroflexota bacterium]
MSDHLRQISPDLLWSTAYITSDEHAYVMAAHDLDIPVLASILSFDNLTSRTSYLQRFYHYTVWSEWMKQQLVRFYPHVFPEQVTVTGTPQFDFHRRKEYCLTRQETLALLGLAANVRYFVYGASTRQLAPEEPGLVRLLAQWISKDERLKNHKVIVRLHPLDDWTRWQSGNGCLDSVIFSGAWTTRPDSGGWAFITPEEQMRLVSLLIHADACINIASTIGLDAAVLDRPVIGIDFRNEPQAPRDLLYDEYYTEHYLPLIESGAVKVASSWDQLMDLLNEAVLSPDRYQENRRQAVRKLCGVVDGHAATRLASTVLDLLTRARRI